MTSGLVYLVFALTDNDHSVPEGSLLLPSSINALTLKFLFFSII